MRSSITRALRMGILVSVALVGLTGLTGLANPAAARTQDRVVVRNGQPAKAAYDQFTRDLPQGSVSAPDPSQCTTALHCDTIPLQVDVPTNIGKADDYYLELTIEWDDEFTNLDAFLWDDGQTKEKQRKQPGEDGYTPDQTTNDYTQIANAIEGRPLKIVLVEPRLVNYNITVLNTEGGTFGGASGPYRVLGRIVVNAYIPPSEPPDDDPVFTPSDFGDDGTDISSSDANPFGDLGAGGTPSNPFNLGSLNVACDPLLCEIGDTDIETTLAAPIGPGAPRTEELIAESPGAAVLLLWLVVVPVLAALGGAYLLRRRRLSAFTAM